MLLRRTEGVKHKISASVSNPFHPSSKFTLKFANTQKNIEILILDTKSWVSICNPQTLSWREIFKLHQQYLMFPVLTFELLNIHNSARKALSNVTTLTT